MTDWLTYLDRHGVDCRAARLEDVAGFVAWLRLSSQARDGLVSVLPTVEPFCSASSVNRKLSAVTSFCGFYARHGVSLWGLLITMQPNTNSTFDLVIVKNRQLIGVSTKRMLPASMDHNDPQLSDTPTVRAAMEPDMPVRISRSIGP